MILTDFLLCLLTGPAVGWVLGSLLGWAVTRRTMSDLYGKPMPFSWWIFAGPEAYYGRRK